MKRKKYQSNGKKERSSDSTKANAKKRQMQQRKGNHTREQHGKLFERIMNNRLTKTVKITDAQAGGQKGKATADHILILNTIITQEEYQKRRPAHNIPGCNKSVR